MTIANTERTTLLSPGQQGPALIAHKAGNTATNAIAAIEDVADYLEVDLWVNHGHFEARHEHRLFSRLPILFEGGRLSLAPRARFGLAELLAETKGRIGIMLDLKNGGIDAARLVKQAIEKAGPNNHRLVASSQLWTLLRAMHDIVPGVDLFYSMGVRSQLDLFLSVAQRDARPRGVSCRDSLLNEHIVKQLHDQGLLVIAWTVDDVERAAELAAMGVDGITTHRVVEIRERLSR
ncbi:MAG: glycerophosphodiester phosphodiesterase [Hyphomicrobiales bacterium]